MDHAKQLIAVIDEPGAERDALAEAITCDGMWVFAADNIDHLPSGTALIVNIICGEDPFATDDFDFDDTDFGDDDFAD